MMTTRPIRKLAVATFLVAGLVLSLASGVGGDQCDRACTLLSNCEAYGASCWSPSYDACVEECEADGDWSSLYTQCLEDNYPGCCAMQDCG